MLFFCLLFEFGISPHNAETLASVDDGAKVKIKKPAEREQKNLTFVVISRDESVSPEEQHKQGRGSPNRDSEIDNELQHS